MAAACVHLRLPILLAVSLLAGVAGDEWVHRWLPHSAARHPAVRGPQPRKAAEWGTEVPEPAASPGDLATSQLP